VAYLVLATVSGTVVYALLARGPQGTITLGTPRLVVLEPPLPPPVTDDSGPPTAAPKRKARPRRHPTRKRSRTVATPKAPVKPTAPSAPTPEAEVPAPKTPSAPKAGPHTPKAAPSAPKAEPSAKKKRDEAEDAIDRFRAGLNAESVRMVVRHHLPQVRACYDRALKQKPSLAGIVEIRFTISVEGRVTASSVHRNTSGHEGLGKCLAVVIKRWRFPRPVGGAVDFVYPFVFSAAE
jgi:TonB family protein